MYLAPECNGAQYYIKYTSKQVLINNVAILCNDVNCNEINKEYKNRNTILINDTKLTKNELLAHNIFLRIVILICSVVFAYMVVTGILYSLNMHNNNNTTSPISNVTTQI